MTVLELSLAGFVILTAALVAVFRDLVGAVATFAAFSLGIAIVWLLLAAPDVALTEAAVGAGVMAVLLLVGLLKTSRGAFENGSDRLGAFRRVDTTAAVVVTALAVPLAYSASFFPPIGDPEGLGVSPTDPAGDPTPYHYYVGGGATDVELTNAVASVLVVYRPLDTFGEVIVTFTAVIGVLVVLARERISDRTRTGRDDPNRAAIDTEEAKPVVTFPDPYVMSPVVTTAIRIVVPLVFAFGVYLTLHGTHLPAGGFQGGIVMGSAFVLVGIAFGLGPTYNWIDKRALIVTMGCGIGLFVAVAFGPVAVGDSPFEIRAYATATPLAVELVEIGIGALVGAVVTTLTVLMAAGVANRPDHNDADSHRQTGLAIGTSPGRSTREDRDELTDRKDESSPARERSERNGSNKDGSDEGTATGGQSS